MKTSVTSYSFGPYMNSDKLGTLGIIDKAAEMGFDGIEFSEGAWTCGLSNDVADSIKERAGEKNLEIVSLCMHSDFLTGSGGNLDEEIERTKKWVDFASRMGAKKMRHDMSNGFRKKGYSVGYDDALPRLARGALEVTKYAETLGVETMTENHGFFSQDARRVEKLINTVAHPNFGALVDVGNFMCADEDPNISVGILAPYAKHVHAKDFFFKRGDLQNPGDGWFRTRAGNYLRGTIIGHGEARVAQSLFVLKKAGYDGYVTVEFEGMEDNIRGIELGLKNLQSYIK